MCDQQKLRSACAYAQSDQSLCSSLEYFKSVKLLTRHHLGFLSVKGGCKGSSESTLVKMSHCWKSHVAAQLYYKSNFPTECQSWKRNHWSRNTRHITFRQYVHLITPVCTIWCADFGGVIEEKNKFTISAHTR